MLDIASEVEVKVPDIGVPEAGVLEILVKVGDSIKVGDVILVLEADKATVEVPSSSGGVVKSILVNISDKVRAGMPVLLLSDDGASADSQVSSKKKEASGALQSSVSLSEVADGSRDTANTAGPHLNKRGPVRASPVVKKLARELGVDLNELYGTGDKGRITEADVRNHLVSVKQSVPDVAAVAEKVPSGVSVADFSKFGDVEVVQLTRVQVASARHLHNSWLECPTVTHFDEADVTELDSFRRKLDAIGKVDEPKYRVSFLPFVMKALAMAFKSYPKLASSLSADGTSVICKKYANIGFAVDTPGGLLVPVIKNVDCKGIIDIAREVSEVSSAAVSGKLTAERMQGGVFTISSLGGIGGVAFTPIINMPEVAILGVQRTKTMPVWDRDEDDFVPRVILPLCLSFNHRVVDGALAARFCREVAESLGDIRNLIL